MKKLKRVKESMVNEQHEVKRRKAVMNIIVEKSKSSQDNYYNELEDRNDNIVMEDNDKLNYEQLYYKHTNKTKILYDYVYE